MDVESLETGPKPQPYPPLALRQRLARALSVAGQRLVETVYPPSCIACATAVSSANSLCAGCWRALSLIERPFCERLGTPFAIDVGGPLLSPSAIADPPVFERARAVCRHDGIARELVLRLKYGDRCDLAEPMGRWMLRAGTELIAQADVIAPVPLHRWRLWRRRFNQAALLAAVVSRETAKPVEMLALARVRRTRQQVGLSRDERRRNLQGAFRVADEGRIAFAGRRVLLIDDVLTSGSTANAATRALLRAGATAVDVLTFSRVVSDGFGSYND